MIMKRNYTLNLCYVLCVVILLLAYPLKNYSANVSLTNPTNIVKEVEKPVAQETAGPLPIELLFKY
jgi:uncharacterized membrane protein